MPLMNSILYFLVEWGADDQPRCGLKGFARETPQRRHSVSQAGRLRRFRRFHRRFVRFVLALGVLQRQVARTAGRPVARRSCWAVALTHSVASLIIIADLDSRNIKRVAYRANSGGAARLFHTGIARRPTGGVVIYFVRLTLYRTGKQYHHQRLERETRGSPYQFGCALCEQNDFVAAPLPASGLRACISPVARWSCWAVALTHNTTPLLRLRYIAAGCALRCI